MCFGKLGLEGSRGRMVLAVFDCWNWGRTYIVKVYVDAPVMCENKVSYSVRSLYRLRVVIESRQKPWVLRGNQFSGLGIGP